MLILDRRRTLRAAYWALLACFGVSIVIPVLVDQLPLYVPVSRETASWVGECLTGLPWSYVLLGAAMALIGYHWPRDVGHPSRDAVARACALGVVVGLIVMGLMHYIRGDVGFWDGFKVGFLLAAVVPPPADERRR